MTAPTRLATAAGADLLAAYDPREGFLLARDGTGLVTRGTVSRIDVDPGPGLVARAALGARRALAGAGAEAIVCGALPFDDDTPARLTVPEDVVSGTASVAGAVEPAPAARAPAVEPEPEPSAYADAVRRALERIDAGEVAKVVLARSLRVRGTQAFDPAVLLRRLWADGAGAYVFAAPGADGAVLVGASPELLVRRRGSEVVAEPMAGSRPRAEGVAGAERLLASDKDRREHALVVEAAAEGLAPFCTSLEVAREPGVVATATMWHLVTPIRGRLRDPGARSLELAAALHPTPAVCGTPSAAARDLIRTLEPCRRSLYAGLVGWEDHNGDGEWVVALRCAELRGAEARLFAGAGIVAGSDPQGELDETGAKFRTMLDALGL